MDDQELIKNYSNLVEEGRVVDPMNPIGRIVLVQEHNGHLQE